MAFKHIRAAVQALGLDKAADAWNRQVNNTEFQALMASSAIVATVNGEVTTTDRERLLKNATNLETLKSYSRTDIAQAFNGYVQKLETNAVIGEIELEDVISSVDDTKAALLIIATLCDIGSADGDFDKDEIKAVRRIGEMMKIDPEKVDSIIQRFATGAIPERPAKTGQSQARVTSQGVTKATNSPAPIQKPTPPASDAPSGAPWASNGSKPANQPTAKPAEKKDPNRPW